jgi:hypothetical protein
MRREEWMMVGGVVKLFDFASWRSPKGTSVRFRRREVLKRPLFQDPSSVGDSLKAVVLDQRDDSMVEVISVLRPRHTHIMVWPRSLSWKVRSCWLRSGVSLDVMRTPWIHKKWGRAALKGQLREIFTLWFYSSIDLIWASVYFNQFFSNSVSNSPSYWNTKFVLRYRPLRGTKFFLQIPGI